MINFRFHIISLVAVFLALALGIFLGSAVGEPTIVDRLRGQIDHARNVSNARNAENGQLRGENNRLQTFVDATARFSVAGRLAGAEVVVVAERGIDHKPVDATLDLLRSASANAPMIVWLEKRWELTTQSDLDQVASILGATTTTPDALRLALFKALARRFALPPSIGPGTPDLLRQLVDAKFVSIDGIDKQRLATFPLRQAKAVVVGGVGSDITDPNVLLQCVTALATRGISTVAAEISADSTDPAAPKRGDTIAVIRSDNNLDKRVSTVDDLDLSQGRVAAVLSVALQEGANPVVGDYGYGRGARRIAPQPPAQ
jgi:hypothetical protein